MFHSRSKNVKASTQLTCSVLKICSKFTGEQPCRSVISIKLQSNLTEITIRDECSPVDLFHIFRIPFPKNTFGWTLLHKTNLIHERALRIIYNNKSSSFQDLLDKDNSVTINVAIETFKFLQLLSPPILKKVFVERGERDLVNSVRYSTDPNRSRF